MSNKFSRESSHSRSLQGLKINNPAPVPEAMTAAESTLQAEAPQAVTSEAVEQRVDDILSALPPSPSPAESAAPNPQSEPEVASAPTTHTADSAPTADALATAHQTPAAPSADPVADVIHHLESFTS